MTNPQQPKPGDQQSPATPSAKAAAVESGSLPKPPGPSQSHGDKPGGGGGQPQGPGSRAAGEQPGGKTQEGAGDGKKVELLFNDKPTVKLQVPDGVNVRQLWNQFQNDHAHVSDRTAAFPTSFAGHLVNQHGCTQLDKNEKCDEQVKFRIT